MVNTAAAIFLMGQHFINFTPNFVNKFLFVVAILIMFMSTAQVDIHCCGGEI